MARQRPKPHMNRSAIHPVRDGDAARPERPEADSATAVAERPEAQDRDAAHRAKGKAAKSPSAGRRGRP